MAEHVVPFTLERGKPNPYLRAQLLALFQQLKDGEFRMVISDEPEPRSAAQNRALHKMLEPWCKEGHDIEDLKDDLLRAVFGLREKVDAITGEVTHALAEPHTSKLSKAQFSELMQRAVQIAAECGVWLELPDEYRERVERKSA